jgi:hypothetical protein
MGSGFYCQILVGPDEICEAQRSVAIEEVRRFQSRAREAIEKFRLALREGGPVTPTEVEAWSFVHAWWKRGAPDAFAAADLLFGQPDEIRWRPLLGEEPETLVSRFIDWWRVGDEDDTATRSNPDLPGQKIVVCGETTSGGEPVGRSSKLLRIAIALAILPLLGIR